MNILMYLNIPWKFIKQRPQFLAEKIGYQADMSVYYNKPYRKVYVVEDSMVPNSIKLIAKVKIPRKNKILRGMDNLLQRIFIRKYIQETEFVWIMHPEQYEVVSPLISHQKVIYDCMDDYLEFPHLSNHEKNHIQMVEQQLVNRADYIFYTSRTLQQAHKQRYATGKRTFVVNNALEPQRQCRIDQEIKKYMEHIPNKKIVYIGAIAPWFDFESILKIIETHSDISIVLFGPVDCEIPKHPRIYQYGKIPHQSVYTVMECADVLVMPFKVNKLIEAVDPIKVYEYISSYKPVIVRDYPEIDKFKPLIYTYRSPEELSSIIANVKETRNKAEIDKFIMENTWEERAKQIVQILKNEK